MRAGTDSEIAIRLGHAELLEKYVGHRGVIVLSRVDQRLPHWSVSAERAQNGRGFHEVGTCPDDVEDVHGRVQ